MLPSVRAIYRIPADEDCPAHARAIVDRELAARVPRPTLEELELLVSELVTRAVPPSPDAGTDVVAGGRTGAGDEAAAIVLDLRIDRRISCSVIAPPAPDGGDRLRGWSLRMVAGLAERWGVSRTANDATRLWFETALPV